MIEKIEQKLKDCADRLEQSAANHNFLLGCKTALEALANDLKSAAPVAESVVAAVAPADAPAVDAAIATTEAVVSDL